MLCMRMKSPFPPSGAVYSGDASVRTSAVKKYAMLPLCGLALFCARAQAPAINYDESQVPAYVLPDPLTTIAGRNTGTASVRLLGM